MFKDKEARKSIETLVSRMNKLCEDVGKNHSRMCEDNISNFETFEQRIFSKLELLNQALDKTVSELRLVEEREKLNSDFLKKEISEVISFNRDLFVKDFLFNTTKDIRKEFETFKSGILKPLLESRWEYEKAKQGQAVISRGAKIIEERNKLHDDMLAKERTGQDIEKEKIQLATMDKIISEAKE